ncbi:hypothetical protein TRFO_29130 [Tritrichomonas foetus]|uniref:BAR domain-containing protein n=1 Tax=Tritrichomonas foetus TaxID=1144522 RepID=A0A1J4K189_9EUKA|nr:hypothetical protein TRFO_29130 [Tritrichomonas foetus]|eukprot:OHT03518.1 hypothetical protein TRFO_29130 [Tritrichomonas foetus]
MLNSFFFKQPETQDLPALIAQLKAANEKMLARSKSANALGDALYALIQAEAPSFAVYFERVRDIYKSLSLIYETASNDQARALEDLNDIAVRYPIYQKLTDEREILKKHYSEVDQKYHSAKLQLKAQESQINLALYRESRIERAQIAANLIDVLENYISYRNRFNKFVENRSKNAWIRYGESIEKCAGDEAKLMNELRCLCNAIRDHVDEPNKILDIVANSLILIHEESVE